MDIKELIKQFEEIMSATAFAEAGDFDAAKKIISERRKVLLVLTGMESDMKAVKFAINISKRIWAGIEILYINKDKEKKSSLLEGYLKELKTMGIEYQITEGEGSVKEEVTRFIEKGKDIQFVVIDSEDLGVRSAKDQEAVLDEWERLKCPVVLVSGLAQT